MPSKGPSQIIRFLNSRLDLDWKGNVWFLYRYNDFDSLLVYNITLLITKFHIFQRANDEQGLIKNLLTVRHLMGADGETTVAQNKFLEEDGDIGGVHVFVDKDYVIVCHQMRHGLSNLLLDLVIEIRSIHNLQLIRSISIADRENTAGNDVSKIQYCNDILSFTSCIVEIIIPKITTAGDGNNFSCYLSVHSIKCLCFNRFCLMSWI